MSEIFKPRKAQPAPVTGTTLPVHVPPLPLVAGMALHCLACGNPETQKISAVVRSGAWSSNTSGVSVGGGHVWGGPNFSTVGVSSSKTRGMSELARHLAPPPEPRDTSQAGCMILAAVPLIFLGLALLFTFWVAGLAVLGAGAALIGMAVENNKSSTVNLSIRRAKWEQQMRNWDLLFYCPRCDCAFNPTNGECARAGEMIYLLG